MNALLVRNLKHKLTPMCWKCPRSLWAKNKSDSIPDARLTPQVFKGCSEDDRISWDSRSQFCPLIPKE